jgi:hypothetical protein
VNDYDFKSHESQAGAKADIKTEKKRITHPTQGEIL